MNHPGAHHKRRYRAERGVSFLEIVFATIILAMTVATLTSAVHAVSAQQARSAHRLNAAELANRLLIQYIDDRGQLPSEELIIPYGADTYRWRLSVSRVSATIDPQVQAAIDEGSSTQTPMTPDRLRKVAITVWLSERSGGSLVPNTGAPQATVVRLVDPSAVWRRPPNSIESLIQRPGGQEELLERILDRGMEDE